MKETQLKIGSVVLSKKGRDANHCFVVVKVFPTYVLLADGNLHMLNKPKKKNIKHISFFGEVLETIAEKLNANKKVFDSEVNSALRPFNQKDN